MSTIISKGGSWFENCPRDEEGHCKPKGDSGVEGQESGKPGVPPAEVGNPPWYAFPGGDEIPQRRNMPRGLSERAQQWAASLSEDEAKAIKDYSEGGYNRLNDGLRAAGGDPAALTGEDASLYRNLIAAIDKAGKLPAPTVVYRGIRLNYQDEAALVSQAKKAAATGGILRFDAFVSNSLSAQVAADFGDTIFETRARHGAPLLGSLGRGEGEILQKPNTRYRVLSVRERVGVEGKRNPVTVIRIEEV